MKSDKQIGDHIEDMPVKVTEDESAKYGRRLAQIEQEMTEHHVREDDLKKQLKATETRLEAERVQIAGIVRSGFEPRPVRVEHWARFEDGLYEEVRHDTGEVLSGRVRPLTERERQDDLLPKDAGAMLSPEAARLEAEKRVEASEKKRDAKSKAKDAAKK